MRRILIILLSIIYGNTFAQTKKTTAAPAAGTKIKITQGKSKVPANEKWVIKSGDNLKIEFDSVVFDKEYYQECAFKNLTEGFPHIEGITVEYNFTEKRAEYKLLVNKFTKAADKNPSNYLANIARIVPSSFKLDVLKEKKIKEVGQAVLIVYPKQTISLNTCIKSLEITKLPLSKKEKDSLKVVNINDSLGSLDVTGALNSLSVVNSNQENFQIDNEKYYSEFELPIQGKVYPKIDSTILQALFQYAENLGNSYTTQYLNLKESYEYSVEQIALLGGNKEEAGFYEIGLQFDVSGHLHDLFIERLNDTLNTHNEEKKALVEQISKGISLSKTPYMLSKKQAIPVKSEFYVFLTPVYTSSEKELVITKTDKILISSDQSKVEDYTGISNFISKHPDLMKLENGKYKIKFEANVVDLVLDLQSKNSPVKKIKKKGITYKLLDTQKTSSY